MPETSFQKPERIGPYVIEGLYAEGGMSLVYLGCLPDTLDPVIIKVLKPSLRDNPGAVAKFRNEARVLELADHPNIVSLYGYDTSLESPYIALEYIQGHSLAYIIQHHPLSLRRSLEIIIEVAYAICHLHILGVIHRDLKPENILITDQGTVKLIDPGVAQLLSDLETGVPAPEEPQLVGTPMYMSPEQHSFPQQVSYTSDIYSLGIIAYELIMGRLSHGKIQLSLLPKGLQTIISKALQKDVQQRYGDIVDFISDLSAYLNSALIDQERKGTDQLTELSEHVRAAQSLLLPSPPVWPGIESAATLYQTTGVSGVYYEFVTLPDQRYAVLLIEPASKGVEGLMLASMIRGALSSLDHLQGDLNHVVNLLNDLLLKDAIHRQFFLHCALLSPKDNSLTAFSCGHSNLWHLPQQEPPIRLTCDNPPLATPARTTLYQITRPWHNGDLLILHTNILCSPRTPDSLYSDQTFSERLLSYRGHTSQKLIEHLLRRAAYYDPPELERAPIALIALRRTQET